MKLENIMKATYILRQEHKLIHRMLDVVRVAVDLMKNGRDVTDRFLMNVAEFFREFADKYHFGKEEGKLFEEMERAGVFTQQLPIESIRHDHFVGRAYINKIILYTGDCRQDDPDWRENLISNLENFIEHIEHHSRKEDRVLYPLSDSLINSSRNEKVIEFYQEIDRQYPGYKEKYTRMVEQMEQELGLTTNEHKKFF